jgi:transposase
MAKRKRSTFERINLERMNRRQRRELRQRLEKSDPGLEVVHPNAAGIDVGNQSHFVAVPGDRDAQSVREFGCWTSDLVKMAKWLKGCGIETVLVQATGVYWIALKDIVEQQGIEVVVANAQHTKNLPGRKSDVQECQWLMKLHTYGLVRGSFQLAEDMQGVRAMWRLRGRHVEEASRAVQHMQKALTQMNVQLANVLSDISGKSGQAIVGAILAGERDPGKLAELCDRRVQASAMEVAESLRGNWRDEMLFELGQARESYQFALQQIQSCDRELESYLKVLPTRQLEIALPRPEPSPATAVRARKAPRQQGHTPDISGLRDELVRICGVDLTTIDGISVITTQTILAEIGTDMGRFPSEQAFVSWLGLTPSRDVSGGKLVRAVRRKVSSRAAQALRMAATTLRCSNSYLGARYRHLQKQLPSKASAVKAMARYLGVLVYRLLTKGQAWVDRGAARFEQKRKALNLASLQARALASGYQLVPVTAV